MSIRFLFTWLLLSSFTGIRAQSYLNPAGSSVYRLAEMRDSFSTYAARREKVLYIHSFTYDAKGRPFYHKWDYYSNGKLASSSNLKYAYDADGKLLSQISDKLRILYGYNKNAAVTSVRVYLPFHCKWELFEETFLEEKKIPPGDERLVVYRMYKRKADNRTMGPLEEYCHIEYATDSSNNIVRSKVYSSNYSVFPKPRVYTYYYDNKPNPLQNVFMERWYQFDLENGGLANVLNKKMGNSVTERRVYEYNESGYPLKCVINSSRTKMFRYERIEVPVQEPAKARDTVQEPVHVMNAQASIATVLIYPNPTTAGITISAVNLGKGTAVVRLYDLFNLTVYKQVSYDVVDKLEAQIPLGGVPRGTYILEIVSPKKVVISKKLILQ